LGCLRTWFTLKLQNHGFHSIGGAGHWDYLLADSENRRLYVSHNAEVVVIDLDSQKDPGKIAVGGFSHGIAIAPDVHLGSSRLAAAVQTPQISQ